MSVKALATACAFFASGMFAMNALHLFLRSAEGITVIIHLVGVVMFAAAGTRFLRELAPKS